MAKTKKTELGCGSQFEVGLKLDIFFLPHLNFFRHLNGQKKFANLERGFKLGVKPKFDLFFLSIQISLDVEKNSN
jgi:hypothetical protein